MSSTFNREVAINVVLSLALRGAFFSLCRTFVKRTLLADLQQVITEEDLTTEDEPGLELPRLRSPRRSPVPRGDVSTSKTYPRLATLVFCLAFSESCVLCSIIILENAIPDRSVWLIRAFKGLLTRTEHAG
jgi:hypothetical protein